MGLGDPLFHARHVILKRPTRYQGTFDGGLVARLNERLAELGAVERPYSMVTFDRSGAALVPLFGQPPEDPKRILHAARALEIRFHLEKTGAIQSLETGFFRLPSGSFAGTFIRPADAFINYATIEAWADWLDQYVEGPTGILSDTWTLLPLMQELAARAIHRGSGPVLLRPLRGYPDAAEILSAMSEVEIELGGTRQANLVFLMSVGASGKLEKKLHLARHFSPGQNPLQSARVLVLVATHANEEDAVPPVASPGAPVVLCQYGPVRRGDDRTIAPASPQYRAVVIHRQKYYPVPDETPRPAMLSADAASRHRLFWEACERTEAVTVGRYDAVLGRRLGIHIDSAALLADPVFRRGVQRALWSSIPACDLVMLPWSGAQGDLALLLQEVFPSTEILMCGPAEEEGSIEARLASVMGSKRSILIADDAIVYGHTVRRCHRIIQRVFGRAGPAPVGPSADYHIRVFAVIARMSASSQWRRLAGSLFQERGEDFLFAAHRLLIPSARMCPFAHELNLLKGVVDAGLPASLERSRVLESADGVRRGLFAIADGDAVQRLSPHSLFGEGLTEVVAYAAVATAMQEIRDEHAGRGENLAWHIPRILTAYHDPILAASFCRCLYHEEVMITGQWDEIEVALRESSFQRFSGTERMIIGNEGLASELVLACIAGRLPLYLYDAVKRRTLTVLQHKVPAWLEVLQLLSKRRLLLELETTDAARRATDGS